MGWLGVLWCGPLLENLLEIGRTAAGDLGMIGCGGMGPASCLVFHSLEEQPRITGIAVGIEGHVQ